MKRSPVSKKVRNTKKLYGLSFPLSFIITPILMWIWFKRGKWKEKDITKEIKTKEKITEETIMEEGTQ